MHGTGPSRPECIVGHVFDSVMMKTMSTWPIRVLTLGSLVLQNL